jgi:predicted ABC-type transport system involved in lysophospholipase L1 biosynthesis ATPase subunit
VLTLPGFDEGEATRRAARWLEWVGLGRLTDRGADRLSGGEQRCVALALGPTPHVLFADETTAYLDRVAGGAWSSGSSSKRSGNAERPWSRPATTAT